MYHLGSVGILVLIAFVLAGCGAEEAVDRASAPPSRATGSQEDSAASGMPPLDFEQGCLSPGCHDSLGATRRVHGPVAVEACDTCHRAIGTLQEHRFVPARAKEELCSVCHSSKAVHEYSHEPFFKSECGKCHDPHGGSSKSFLVAESVSALCATCHDRQRHAFTHHPVEEGDCLVCHAAHSSENKHLLVRQQTELCLGCHKDYRALVPGGAREFERTFLPDEAPDPESPVNVHAALEKGGCGSCHHAHGGAEREMLRGTPRSVCESCHEKVLEKISSAVSVHGAFEDQDSCTKCHLPHAGNFDVLLRDSPDTLCFQCHDRVISAPSGRTIPDMQRQFAEAKYLHEPVEKGNCAACHLAHFSAQRSLLKVKYPNEIYAEFADGAYELCFLCHDQELADRARTTYTRFRDGDRNLHYVHIHQEKGRACDICHEAHGGQLPNLMRSTFPFGPGGWQLPIGYVQTKTGGSCVSGCHDEVGYDRIDPRGQGKVESIGPDLPGETTDRPSDAVETVSQLIQVLNERFGTDFSEADRALIAQLEEQLAGDRTLIASVETSGPENARLTFDQVVNDRLQERIDENREFRSRFAEDREFSKFFLDWLFVRFKDSLARTHQE